METVEFCWQVAVYNGRYLDDVFPLFNLRTEEEVRWLASLLMPSTDEHARRVVATPIRVTRDTSTLVRAAFFAGEERQIVLYLPHMQSAKHLARLWQPCGVNRHTKIRNLIAEATAVQCEHTSARA